MRELLDRDAARAYVERCIDGLEGPAAHASARDFCAERGFGKVPNVIEGGDRPLKVMIVRDIGALDGSTDGDG